MRLGHYVKRALVYPPHVTLQLALRVARREWDLRTGRLRDERRTTYHAGPLPFQSAALARRLPPPAADALKPHAELYRALAERYLAHEFDLLGSGWVHVHHGMTCHGVLGRRYETKQRVSIDRSGRWLGGRINVANLPEAQRLWGLVDPDYQPIDWHLDFKSGYRWDEATWFHDVRYAHEPGVDIKVPWELARMQHLPQLALAYAASTGESDRYRREFRNQVVDFLATNPPRYGVNWRCTMDVAIRVANWLVAYDLFRASGARFDPDFEAALLRGAYEHGRYIVRRLEWSETLRGNHYLSDIVGLAFVAAYLPASPETDAWLALSVQELVAEVASEFTPDGANFEASTVYHRLSAELASYATALIMGLPPDRRDALKRYDHRRHAGPPRLRPAPLPLHALENGESPFPAWYFERLERAGEFTRDLTQGGQVVQVGDNDSGRFLKLLPAIARLPAHTRYLNLTGHEAGAHETSWAEDALDHRHLLAAIAGLCDRPDLAREGHGWELEAKLMSGLAGGKRFPSFGARPPGQSYPDFGLYLIRSACWQVCLRCGPNGQNGNGGHAHNDQLSFQATLEGRPWIIDPGTGLYTPFPAMRNHFRATATHNTLSMPGKEQNAWREGASGLFLLANQARAQVLELQSDRFSGQHHGFGTPHRRTLTVTGDRLTGTDSCDLVGTKVVSFHLAPGITAKATDSGVRVQGPTDRALRITGGPGTWTVESAQVSPAYGVFMESQVVRLTGTGDRFDWRIEVVDSLLDAAPGQQQERGADENGQIQPG